jgi:hypothetical protein
VKESDDPEVIEKLPTGIPFDQIALPPEQFALPLGVAARDTEVVEYLKYNEFSLGPRLRFVSEQLDLLKGSVGLVPCPRCEAGRLGLDPEHWEDPNVI